MASDIDVFVRPEEAVEITRAIAQVYGELGNRENRGICRMRYLVQELGPEGFRAEVAARSAVALAPAGEQLTRRYRGDHVGVHAQTEPGRHYVGLSVTVGRMSGRDLVEAARLPDRISEAVDIGVGGSLGTEAAFTDWVAGAKPIDEVPEALVRVLRRYRAERRASEPFHRWSRRQANADVRATLNGSA